MGSPYVQQRPNLISRLLDLSSKFGLRDEIVHDAVLLMDRTASQAQQVPEDVLPLVSVAALLIAAKQGDPSAQHVPSSMEIEQLTGKSACNNMGVLMLATCSLRCCLTVPCNWRTLPAIHCPRACASVLCPFLTYDAMHA